jgi:hypothetical protein
MTPGLHLESPGIHLESIWSPPGIHRNFGSEFTAKDLDRLGENNTKRYCISWKLNPKPGKHFANDIPDQLTTVPDRLF